VVKFYDLKRQYFYTQHNSLGQYTVADPELPTLDPVEPVWTINRVAVNSKPFPIAADDISYL
jgi:hypothetical protein